MKTEQEKKEERYLISETAKLVGVESHVLRYWEEELKLPIRRNELGHRYYTREDVEQFREIKKLKEQGLQLKAIRTVLTAEGSMQILMPVPEKEGEHRREMQESGDRVRKESPAETEQRALDAGEKAMRLQMLLHSLVSQAVRENNEELTRQIRETITKEMDYQFRIQEEESRKREQEHMEKEEEHFRKLDETLRQYAGRGRAVQASLRETKRQQKLAARTQKVEQKAAQKAAREAEAKSRREAAKSRRESGRLKKGQERQQREKEKEEKRKSKSKTGEAERL